MNNHRIFVQKKMKKSTAFAFAAVLIIIAFVFVSFILTNDSLFPRAGVYCFYIVVFLLVFIPLLLNNAQSSVPFVSEIIVTDSDLILVHKVDSLSKEQIIKLSDIKSIKATLKANNVSSGRSVSLFCETVVNIETKSDGIITFSEVPTASWSFCGYSFMLRLLSISYYLPNFTYKVIGNSETAKADVQHFALYGKRLPFLKRMILDLKIYPLWIRLFIALNFLLFLVLLGFTLCMNFPVYLSSEDKIYMENVERGYTYYQDGQYENSLSEYNKALNIHDNDPVLYYYQALSYQRIGELENAVESAQKGIKNAKNKSVYHKAKKFIFANNDIIGLYTVLGESEYYLQRYDKALEAFNYIAKKVVYKYTDVYLWRGLCYMHLGDNNHALKDYYKHKEIILNYIDEQARSDYPMLHPTYTNDDLERINKLIKDIERYLI